MHGRPLAPPHEPSREAPARWRGAWPALARWTLAGCAAPAVVTLSGAACAQQPSYIVEKGKPLATPAP